MKRIRLPLVLLLIALGLAALLTLLNPLRLPVATSTPTLAIISTQAASNCAPTTVTLVANADKFSVAFPCAPLHTVRKANAVPFGEIEIISEEVNVDGVDYAAAYVNYADKLPAVAFDIAQGIILDGAKRAVVRGQPVQNPVYKEFKLGDIPGVEITAEGTEKRLHARIWLVRQTTYQLIVVFPKSWSDETMIDRFLLSFTPVSR